MTEPRRPGPAPRPQPPRAPAPPPSPPPHGGLQLLAGLTGERLIEAVVAAEILAPPVAFRDGDTFGPRTTF